MLIDNKKLNEIYIFFSFSPGSYKTRITSEIEKICNMLGEWVRNDIKMEGES